MAIPIIFEKMYPLSKKLEKILMVNGRNIKPITKKTNHHWIINVMSEKLIVVLNSPRRSPFGHLRGVTERLLEGDPC